MINLFDRYDQYSWDLHFSLLKSGYTHTTIVLHDDGFLPEDVTSPYLYFTGYDNTRPQSPLYFNQLAVPNYWEIRGDNVSGSVWDYDVKRANLLFASPTHHRWIQTVEWLDRQGVVRTSDCYNKFGKRYIQRSYTSDGQHITSTYYDANGREVIVENHITQNVLLNLADGTTKIFANTIDFVIFYLKHSNQCLDRIFYNSLGLSFLVAYYLQSPGNDILFWHEDIEHEIPGNMKLLLEHPTRATQIFVQNQQVYDKMQPLLDEASKQLVEYLGFLYPLRRNNKGRKEALILTNSDHIEQLNVIVNQLPEMNIHIGALTEMSTKLMAFGAYPNVTLYPNIPMSQVERLYNECDLYLDINHGNEILSAVRAAFENQMLVVAFDETAHARKYTAAELIYPSQHIHELLAMLKTVLHQPAALENRLKKQQLSSSMSTAALYKNMIG